VPGAISRTVPGGGPRDPGGLRARRARRQVRRAAGGAAGRPVWPLPGRGL